MKTEYRLCVARCSIDNRVQRYPKKNRDHAETDAADYADLLERGFVNRVWVETRQVGKWQETDGDYS